jgi:hypothetical protein
MFLEECISELLTTCRNDSHAAFLITIRDKLRALNLGCAVQRTPQLSTIILTCRCCIYWRFDMPFHVKKFAFNCIIPQWSHKLILAIYTSNDYWWLRLRIRLLADGTSHHNPSFRRSVFAPWKGRLLCGPEGGRTVGIDVTDEGWYSGK